MMFTFISTLKDDSDLAAGRPPAGLLTHDELAIYRALKSEKRRQDWLHGRYAAKHLLRRVYQEVAGIQLSFNDFAVLPKENGAPVVQWLCRNGYRPVILSISHAGDLAFCAVSLEAGTCLGCDVEQIMTRSSAFIADYLTPAEQALVQQADPEWNPLLVNTIWSAKEAVLKALELGLTVDTRAVSCLPDNRRVKDSEWLRFTITLDPERISRPAADFHGWWRVQDANIFTLAVSNLEKVDAKEHG